MLTGIGGYIPSFLEVRRGVKVLRSAVQGSVPGVNKPEYLILY